MSKKKWTDWIDFEPGDWLVAEVDEVLRVEIGSGVTVEGPCICIVQECKSKLDYWKRYKRLKKNVRVEKNTSGVDHALEASKAYASLNFGSIASDIAALKGRPETRRGPFVIKDEDLPDKATGFLITGPGEYVTRSGEKAIITERTGKCPYMWGGEVNGYHRTWDEDGAWGTSQDYPHDIIGPWVEPVSKPTRTLTGWVNVYIGRPHFGVIHDTEKGAKDWADSNGHLATLPITYTVGDE